MKKILHFAFLILPTIQCLGQINSIVGDKTDYGITSIGDTYIVRLAINSVAFAHPCNCASGKKGNCILYQGKIENIFSLPPKTVFDSTALNNCLFFLAAANDSLKVNNVYIVGLRPGTSEKYLVVNRRLAIINPEKYLFVHLYGYYSGYIHCTKIGIVNKILLFLHLRKIENIDENKLKNKSDIFNDLITKK